MNHPARISAGATETSRAAKVQIVQSTGGVVAWLVEDYAVPLIAMDFSFRGGAAQDPENKTGLATMLAGLLDEGAGPYESEAFHEQLDDLAAHLSFGADRDHLSGHFQTLARNADQAFDLLRLAVTEARLDAQPIDRVRSQLSASLRRELKDPDAMAARLFRKAAFPNHPYGRPARGDLETLPDLTREDLLALRKAMMARNGLTIAVVGAIDAKRLSAKLDQIFGALPEKGALAPVSPIVMTGIGERLTEKLDVPQATIRFGRPGLGVNDPDFMAGVVVNHILGGGSFTARLFREVREKRGLAYSVYSQLQNFDHASCLIGATSTKNERAAESLTVIEEQIRDLAEQGPTEEELDKARKYLIGSYALRFDTSTKIAGNLAHLQREGRTPAYLDERNRLIAAVTLEDARRAAQRLLGDGRLLVTVAGKPEGM